MPLAYCTIYHSTRASNCEVTVRRPTKNRAMTSCGGGKRLRVAMPWRTRSAPQDYSADVDLLAEPERTVLFPAVHSVHQPVDDEKRRRVASLDFYSLCTYRFKSVATSLLSTSHRRV